MGRYFETMSLRKRVSQSIIIVFLLATILLVVFFVLPKLSNPKTDFIVYFLDVGQADAAIVQCDGQVMMIDGGNVADSSHIYTFLKDHGIDHIDYIVCTHAHEDHVGGLAGSLNACMVGTVFAPVTDYDSEAFRSFKKYVAGQGKKITVPIPGDVFSLGSAKVTILGPLREYEDQNNMSIVLRIVYGKTSFLFTGDIEWDAEHDLTDAGYDLHSTVLKVAHHGSETSTSYVFLREVMPQFAVISVGKGNAYGHPDDVVLSRLRDADVTVYRTDEVGEVVCTSDGANVRFKQDTK
jgi:competence protein ComEC